MEILVKKCENGWWPRLVATPQKPHWLKVDFDRWQTEDDVDEQPRDVLDDYSKEYDRLQKEEFGYIKGRFSFVSLLTNKMISELSGFYFSFWHL